MSTTTSFYEQNATQLAQQYDSLTFETVHKSWQSHWPQKGASVLDIGAGSGRDAKWLRAQGCKIVAVEPCDALRDVGKRQTGRNVIWLSDSLPNLKRTRDLGLCFDVILLSAVWMHLSPDERPTALDNLAQLLTENGKLVISLRHGEFNDGRKAYPVSVNELEALSREIPLRVNQVVDCSDSLQRSQVNWQTVVLASPTTK